MTAKELFEKAATSLNSSQLLFSSGDYDGACNRAYYAMFDAARAALLIEEGDDSVLSIKTHSGLISTFGIRLVKSGKVSLELGPVGRPNSPTPGPLNFPHLTRLQ